MIRRVAAYGLAMPPISPYNITYMNMFILLLHYKNRVS